MFWTSEWFVIIRYAQKFTGNDISTSSGAQFNQDEQLGAFCSSSAQHASWCFSCGPFWVLQPLFWFVSFIPNLKWAPTNTLSLRNKVYLISESLRRVSPVRKPFELLLSEHSADQLVVKKSENPRIHPKSQTQIGRKCMLAGILWMWCFCAAFQTTSIGVMSLRSTSNTIQRFLTR